MSIKANKELLKALEESVVHWSGMIEWAKTQSEKASPCESIMRRCIGESWGSFYCPLCQYIINEGLLCKVCPGNQDDICDHIYRMLCISTTWEEWLVYANKILKALKREYKKYSKEMGDKKK